LYSTMLEVLFVNEITDSTDCGSDRLRGGTMPATNDGGVCTVARRSSGQVEGERNIQIRFLRRPHAGMHLELERWRHHTDHFVEASAEPHCRIQDRRIHSKTLPETVAQNDNRRPRRPDFLALKIAAHGWSNA